MQPTAQQITTQQQTHHNMSKQPVNPHSRAAGAYDQHAKSHTPDARELEARILLKAANQFQKLQENWADTSHEALDEAVTYNRQVWMMFVDTAVNDGDPARPNDLRSNIANLGAFIFKHSINLLAEPKPEKLNILIEINREIAAGLMTSAKLNQEQSVAPPPTESGSHDIGA